MDRTQAGMHSNTTMQGGLMPLPAVGLQTGSLTLRLFVDRSMLEVGPQSYCHVRLRAVHALHGSMRMCHSQQLSEPCPAPCMHQQSYVFLK